MNTMTRRLQKIGNSKGVVLTRTMIEHLGVQETIEITMEEGRIILTVPQVSPRRQSFEEAKNATFAQYGDALQRLADA
jgi:antitoxin component of MazEF toxin-antitoxin module